MLDYLSNILYIFNFFLINTLEGEIMSVSYCKHSEEIIYGKCNDNIVLTDEFIIEEGIRLSRIVAVRDFNNINKSDRGGFIQSLDNLSGNAWVADNAKVFGKAIVRDNAVINGNAVVRGEAVVGNYSEVSDMAIIKGRAKVSGWAKISGSSLVDGNARVSGAALIGGSAIVRGYVSGNALLTCRREVEPNEVVTGMVA